MAFFYLCKSCGSILEAIDNVDNINGNGKCSKNDMELLSPNTTEAAGEKHMPIVKAEQNTVYVNAGATTHPMLNEHHIKWVYVETTNGGHLHKFSHDDSPAWAFHIGNEKPLMVYAYCNLHGLWATEIN